MTTLLTPAQIKPKSFESRQNSFLFFFNPGWMRLMFTCVLGHYVASTVLLAPKPSAPKPSAPKPFVIISSANKYRKPKTV